MGDVLDWNGKDLPEELEKLPAGRYVVERVDDVPELTPEQEAGLRKAMASLESGGGLDITEVRKRIKETLNP